MDQQTDSGHGEMPFAFTTNILPFDPPSVADSSLRRAQPRPDALDFDVHMVELHERELQHRSRFEPASESECRAAPMVAAPALPIDQPDAQVDIAVPDGVAFDTAASNGSGVDDPAPKLFDFDPDPAPAARPRRGVFAMAGVACVALFMTGVSFMGNDDRSTTPPLEMARRGDAPVVVRSGVADQAFEYTTSSYELDTEAVEPIVLEVCSRLAGANSVNEVVADARLQLFALGTDLAEADADAIIMAGVEANCMEHLLTLE